MPGKTSLRPTSCLRGRGHLAILAIASLALAACGPSGPGAPGGPPAGGAVPPQGATTAVVTADVDVDGANDILEIPLGVDADDARCWRGGGGGSLEDTPQWCDHPAVDAIRNDLERRTEEEILDHDGGHVAPGPGTSGVPYAVMHLEHADTEPAGDPAIDALHPEKGHPGSLVGVKGSGLAAREQDTAISFDDLDARVLIALPRYLLAIVPERAPIGLVDVVVTRGTAASMPAVFEVVSAPKPLLESAHPNPVVPGIVAVLTGEHLGTPIDDVVVDFAGVEADKVLALGSIVFAVVPDAAVSGLVTVTVNGVASNGLQLEVASDLDAPTLSTVEPASASPGSLVRILGDDLFVIGEKLRVHFGTAAAPLFGKVKGGVVAMVPAGADGDVTITVGKRKSNGLPFQLLDRGTPTIASIDPAMGEPGDVVDILGTDLYDLTGFEKDGALGVLKRLPKVRFGGRRAYLVFPTIDGLRVVVPLGMAAGAVDVSVEHGGLKSNLVPFTVK